MSILSLTRIAPWGKIRRRKSLAISVDDDLYWARRLICPPVTKRGAAKDSIAEAGRHGGIRRDRQCIVVPNRVCGTRDE